MTRENFINLLQAILVDNVTEEISPEEIRQIFLALYDGKATLGSDGKVIPEHLPAIPASTAIQFPDYQPDLAYVAGKQVIFNQSFYESKIDVPAGLSPVATNAATYWKELSSTHLQNTDSAIKRTSNGGLISADDIANYDVILPAGRFDANLPGNPDVGDKLWQFISKLWKQLNEKLKKTGTFTAGNLIKTNANGEAIDAGINGQAVNWVQEANAYSPTGIETPIDLISQDWSNGVITINNAIQGQLAPGNTFLYFVINGNGATVGDIKRLEFARVVYTTMLNSSTTILDFRSLTNGTTNILHDISSMAAITLSLDTSKVVPGGDYSIFLTITGSTYSIAFTSTFFKNIATISGITKRLLIFKCVKDGTNTYLVCTTNLVL